jgi:polar amino acid transport system ATP-binding protein
MSAPAPQNAAQAPVTKALVELEGIHLSFSDNQVLKGIDLTVNKGDAVSIIGPSGSGKSTILRCINGLLIPQSGKITVGGTRVDQLKTEAERIALRKRIGIVFQQFNLFPHLTVMENITIAPIKILGTPKAEAERHARELLEKVRLSQKVDAYPGQLSGGQQQRVAIARALAMRPELVLFDEVTSALDPELTAEVLKVIEQLAADGMTMVMVTHEMGFAKGIADRIVFMHRGKVHETGPASILTSPTTPELIQFVGTGNLKS